MKVEWKYRYKPSTDSSWEDIKNDSFPQQAIIDLINWDVTDVTEVHFGQFAYRIKPVSEFQTKPYWADGWEDVVGELSEELVALLRAKPPATIITLRIDGERDTFSYSYRINPDYEH